MYLCYLCVYNIRDKGEILNVCVYVSMRKKEGRREGGREGEGERERERERQRHRERERYIYRERERKKKKRASERKT